MSDTQKAFDEVPEPPSSTAKRLADLVARQREVFELHREREKVLAEPGGNALAALMDAHNAEARSTAKCDGPLACEVHGVEGLSAMVQESREDQASTAV